MGEFLVGEGVELDLLHVNHHEAARTSTSWRWCDRRWPSFRSGNGNPYGHPHVEALQRMRRRAWG